MTLFYVTWDIENYKMFVVMAGDILFLRRHSLYFFSFAEELSTATVQSWSVQMTRTVKLTNTREKDVNSADSRCVSSYLPMD